MGSKGANKGFDYNLIKVLDAVISAGNAVKAAKKIGHHSRSGLSGIKTSAKLL